MPRKLLLTQRETQRVGFEVVFHIVPQRGAFEAFADDLVHVHIHTHHARTERHVVVNGLWKRIRLLKHHAHALT